MANPYRQERRKIVTNLLDKFPDASTRSIARMLVKDYTSFFESLEQARNIVNLYRGSAGKYNRENMAFKKYYKSKV